VHYFDLATLSERPYWIAFDMDYVAYLYFAAISVLSGVFFGVLPALRASRVDLASELKEGARNMVAAAGGGRVTGTLVVLQFALTVVLLCAAGLMIRSFFRVQTINPFVPESEIATARVTLPDSQDTAYAGKAERIRFFEDLERRLAAIPGVSHAAIAESLPGGGSGHDPIEIEGQASTATANGGAANSTIRASSLVISPAYLSLIGASMQEGRGFTAQDGDPGREAAIATRRFANRFFPNQQAIGKRFRMVVNGKPGPWNEIVGITTDILQNPQRTEGEDHPLVYLPYRQFGWRGMALLVRASNSTSPAAAASVAANLTTPIKAVVQQIDQDLPVFDSLVLSAALERQRWHLGVFGSLFLSFAIIGLLIASVGIYAVGAQAAASRTREVGIRMALGAGTRDILATMLSRGVTYLAVGLTLGLGGALGVTGLMKGLLMQVSPHDPLVIGTVVVLLAGLGFFACWLPARRAAALHPVEALRDE
jgi:putative ABC transport system permease protein